MTIAQFNRARKELNRYREDRERTNVEETGAKHPVSAPNHCLLQPGHLGYDNGELIAAIYPRPVPADG